MRRGISIGVVATLGLAACGGGGGAPDAPAPGADAGGDASIGPDARILFDDLIDTGLCLDAGCTQIAPTALPYQPRWELYSDGATKRRWITLPPGAQIDTTDMDYWLFPVGTKIWKEFTRDGIRVETRLIQKVGPLQDDWFYTPYVWNSAQDAAVSTPSGQIDANGTMHDVPTRAECRMCHERLTGGALGFGAMQLDFDAPPGELDLADLVAMGALTVDPPGSAPYFPLPPDSFAGEHAALGYLHANCGSCHNPTSDVYRDITDTDLRLRVGALAAAAMVPARVSTINIPGEPQVNGATLRVAPGDTGDSILFQRFITSNMSQRMPRVGTEVMDPAGPGILQTWIDGLPP
jgi:hypothetical protein